MSRVRRNVAAGWLAGLLVAGCNVFEPGPYLAAEADAGRDGGGDARPDGDGPAGCGERRTPAPRPMVEDGEDAGEVVYVLKDIVFNQLGGRWRQIGFDLDGYCTSAEDPRSECTPVEPPIVDGEGGIDNAFGGQLFTTVNAAFGGQLENTSRQYQNLGVGALAVFVRGWNGTADDPRVDVVVAQTVFGTTAEAASAPGFDPSAVVIEAGDGSTGPRLVDGDGNPLPGPAWDGTDVFFVRSDAFVDGMVDQPVVRDEQAYVVGGKLVVQIPDRITLAFSGGEQGVLLRVLGTVAQLALPADPADPAATVDATIAGRWAVSDILRSASAIGFCEGTDLYDLASDTIQRAADVLSRPGGSPEGGCDAVSFGFLLTGWKGTVRGTVEPPPLPDRCAEMADGGVPDGGMAMRDAAPPSM